MKVSFLESLKSRKLIMALLAAVTGFIKVYYPDFPDQSLYTIVGSLMGYVVVQGVVDSTGQISNKTEMEKEVKCIDCPQRQDAKYNNLVSRLNEILEEHEHLQGKLKS